MSIYYTVIISLCWASLGILCLLVHENGRLQKRDKHLLFLTYALIAISALAEYLGVLVSTRSDLPRYLLSIVKCADYILTPMTGGALVFQIRPNSKLKAILAVLLACNTIFQIVAAIGGWMITIDDHNHYTHGPMYTLYIALYLVVILIVLVQFVIYGRSFRKHNFMSLYTTILLIIAGIAIQELPSWNVRITYLTLTIGAMLLYIQYAEYVSLEMDDNLMRQQIQIDTDDLTGVYSRFAYTQILNFYNKAGNLPEKFAVFSIDINGLKQANDDLGHEAGDELICGAADCIVKSLDAHGKCYRTGGDEFVVLSSSASRESAELFVQRLKAETEKWHGKIVKSLSLSVGYTLAEDHDSLSAEMLIRESDKEMYKAKAAYYSATGRDRRSRR